MKGEVPKRLTPTQPVTRMLYLKSGNRCAYPGCEQPLMRPDGNLVGEIVHIKAALPDGARFDDSMSNEERRAEANLMLMCANDHTVIDADVATWPVERLVELKARHEAVYTGAIDMLRRQVGDITEGTQWTSPTDLGRILNVADYSPQEMSLNIVEVERFARRLAALPVGARSVLALIVNRGDGYEIGGAEVQIRRSLLTGLVDCSEDELWEHIDVLDGAGLAWSEDPFSGDPPYVQAGNSTPGIGWPMLLDIKRASKGDPAFVRRILVELDFAALDAPRT